MNFELSDEALMLRDAARRLLASRSGAARAVMEAGDSHDAALWATMLEQGWTAARIPESLGGLGLGAEEACVLVEECGRALAPAPLVSAIAATEALLLAGTAEQQAQWLPKVAAGNAIGCIAWAEGGNSPAMNPSARLESGRLTGVKSPVVDGRAATFAIVTVATDAGPAMAIAALEGARVEAVETLDLVRPSAAIHFDAAPAQPLGTTADWLRLTERLAVLHAFESLGTAEAARDRTVEYAKERIAFGQQIGRYQGVKHRLADAYVKAELARAHALHGCWAWTAGAPELPLAAAAARVASLDALKIAAEEMVQLHGGIGFTWEHDAQLFYRRNRQMRMALGSRMHWQERLVRALERRNRAA